MIVLDQESRIFTLHTRNTAYQMKADQQHGSLHSGESLMEAGYPLPQIQGDYPAFQIYLKAIE